MSVLLSRRLRRSILGDGRVGLGNGESGGFSLGRVDNLIVETLSGVPFRVAPEGEGGEDGVDDPMAKGGGLFDIDFFEESDFSSF